jgi:hypothetical protein
MEMDMKIDMNMEIDMEMDEDMDMDEDMETWQHGREHGNMFEDMET